MNDLSAASIIFERFGISDINFKKDHVYYKTF